jgi:outer membrane protein
MNKFLVFLLLFFPFLIFTQELSLEDCIDYSLKESHKVKASQSAVDSAQSGKNAAVFSFFPTTRFEAGYQWLKFVPEVEPMEFDLSALGIPPVEFGKMPDKNRSMNITSVMPITPLWSVFNGYKAANAGYDIAKIQHELTASQTKLEVMNLYYNYFMLDESSELLTGTKKQLERYRTQAENFVNAGLTDKRAVLKIDIELAKIDQQIQTVEGNKNLLKKNLAIFMNKNADSFTLKKITVKTSSLSTSSENLSSLMSDNRLEFQMLEKATDISKRLEYISFQPLIPTLAIVGGYQRTWDAMQGFQPEGTLFFGGNLSWQIGFDWGKNIFDYKKARSERVKTELENIHAKKMMELQLVQLENDVSIKSSGIKIAKKEVESATENLRIAEDKYREQLTTETELLDASIAYRSAQLKLLSSIYEHEVSLNRLALTIGTNYEEITEGGI